MERKKVCAVVVAAGKSSRMGAFKPLLEIGGVSVSGRVINTLTDGGAGSIAVITGNNADKLEAHLYGGGVVFLRNEDYAHTDMFLSAKIGFRYFDGNFDKLLFTPIDVPLFSLNTVKALLKSDGEIAMPVCGGKAGHPIMLRPAALARVLAYEGENGLRGAIDKSGVSIDYIKVNDEGVLHDMDTPDDYKRLVGLFTNDEVNRYKGGK